MITLNVDVIIERIEFSKNMDDISSFSSGDFKKIKSLKASSLSIYSICGKN